MKLTEFLLARIAEDEADAAASQRDDMDWFDSAHQMRWTPARVLAECGAKRQLIERVGNPAWAGFRILAQPYADHPDYRQEWKP